MNFKKWVKSIQTAGYNGSRKVLKENNEDVFNAKNKLKYESVSNANVVKCICKACTSKLQLNNYCGSKLLYHYKSGYM